MPKLYSAGDVAAELKISTSRIYKLAKQYGAGTSVGTRGVIFTARDIERLRPHAHGKAGRPFVAGKPAAD